MFAVRAESPDRTPPCEDATLSDLGSSDLLSIYRFMLLTRGVEERLETLFKQGHVVGGLYRSLGQEGTAVASARALEDGDWLAPSIRDMGALFVRGLDVREMLRQYTARGSSLCAGKDNTTHFTVPELGLLGPVSPLGTQLCVLNGVALAFKRRGEPRVCMTYQGEGASRTGASHEGFSLAAALDLPIVVFLEHNHWSFGTRSDREAAVDDWLDAAAMYGVPAASVDGNDVRAVYTASREAVDRARSGGGPTFIVAETYRMLGHAQHDAQKYVSEEELESWRARDPISRLEAALVDEAMAGEDELEQVRASVEAELDDAVDDVLSEPDPRPDDARTRVYAAEALDADVPWTRGPVPGYEELGAGG
ncbi:MAG: thiamine pyrophosphate-dependent dehydrogenase E1 component subunit alpha [Gemmatimonadota bacterium]